MPCQVTGSEENYFSITIDKSDVDDSHPKHAKKKNKIQVNASFGHSISSNGDNAHAHFKEKTLRSICTLAIGHTSPWTKESH
jgi:hypothetical protein